MTLWDSCSSQEPADHISSPQRLAEKSTNPLLPLAHPQIDAFPDNQLFVLPLSSFSVVNNPRKRGLEQRIQVLIVICTYLHQGHFIWKLYPIISVLPSPVDKKALTKCNCCYSHCSESLNMKLAGRWKTMSVVKFCKI